MGKKIKVLVITHTFPTKQNPIAAIYLLNQLNVLKQHCDIRIIFPYALVPRIPILNPYRKYADVPSKEIVDGMQVYHPKYLMFPRFFSWPALLSIYLSIENVFSFLTSKKTGNKIAKEWKPDIIHMHGLLMGSFLAADLKRKYNKPLIATVYGDDVYQYFNRFPSRIFSRRAAADCDAIICQSKLLEEQIKKPRVFRGKTHIIPMGATVGNLKTKSMQTQRKELGIPIGKKCILFAGHLVERKGVSYLIEAMKNVVEKEKNCRCYIIGSGDLEGHLKDLTRELNLEDHVVFLGQKKHEDYIRYMQACDLFVLPSLREGLPVVICEAFALGKPVVGTKIDGIKEIVDEESGYLVEPKNSRELAQKIMLALQRKWNGKAILKKGQEFTVENSAKKVLDVYHSFLRNKQN